MLTIESGKLIHNVTFYTQNYACNSLGSGGIERTFFKRVKCSVLDVNYQNKKSGNKNIDDSTLKITTRYFEGSDIKMLLRLNGKSEIYKITHIENVEFRNTVLIFSVSINKSVKND